MGRFDGAGRWSHLLEPVSTDFTKKERFNRKYGIFFSWALVTDKIFVSGSVSVTSSEKAEEIIEQTLQKDSPSKAKLGNYFLSSLYDYADFFAIASFLS